MPQFDFAQIMPQLPWLAGVFLLLFIVSRLAIPRVDRVVENRRDRIADDLKAAEAARDAAKDATSGGGASLQDARARALEIAGDARDRAAAEAATRLAEVDRRLEETTAQAMADLDRTRAGILADLDAIAAEATVDLIERVSGEKIAADAARAAVESVGRAA